ncbi:RNA pol II accessory factor, Cdc73 family [Ancylostoma ceylanicum]|uniref:RNA pol II accessory factor, Cdc73 family n=1 Tax=Ancylostoma ceylanicum TaxID=53326 RepID=A0A0D6LVG8_9BILA|nr:RNA pol II accessory factor, Cdc73 family [Ancylostoma ceylanicum]
MSEILRYLCEVASGQLPMKEIIHNNEKYYAFGDRAYHKDTETNLLVYGKQNDYYTIDALLFLWEHRAKTHPSYVRDATAANVKVVSRPDRREILDYLSGNRAEIPTNHNPSHAPAPGIAISRLVPETIEEPEAKKLKLEHNARPRVDQLLNKDRVDPSEVRALNESLTADKIAALKQKRLTHQKTKIAAVDPEMISGGAPTEPLVTRYSMDVRKVERVYKTRKTVMNATKKTYTFLFDVLKLIKTREEAAKMKERGLDSSKSQPAKFVGMYNRYDQERFGKLNEFQTMGTSSFVGTNLSSISSFQENKPAEVAEPQKQEETKRTALATTIPQYVNSPDEPKKRVSRTPIIIIPSAMTSLLTIFNATDIIQDMNFVTTEEKRKEKNMPRKSQIYIQRKKNDTTDELIAVGQLWQFKPFKRWHSNPVEIFAKIPAFHVHYDDLNVDPNVAKWSVTRLPVSRSKRHMDKARFRVFWEVMDRWIPANRPHLRW